MPSKNILKPYVENGYYHVYNRGVEKRTIFVDKKDELVFLSYLNDYLLPKDIPVLMKVLSDVNSSFSQKAEVNKLLRLNNFNGEISLLAYCLMPNHFHFLIKQNQERSLEKFMRSITSRYVQYFNKSHGGRVGGLFQDTYKAVLVESEEQLIHLSRYIHRNPLGLSSKGYSLKDLKESPRSSSYLNYLGRVKQEWVDTSEILGLFAKSGINSYEAFVHGSEYEEGSLKLVEELLIDIGEDP